jgi:hypothetical protein
MSAGELYDVLVYLASRSNMSDRARYLDLAEGVIAPEPDKGMRRRANDRDVSETRA